MRKYQITLNQNQVLQLVAILGMQSRQEFEKIVNEFNNEPTEGFPCVQPDYESSDLMYSELWDAVMNKPNTPIDVTVLDLSEEFYG